MPLETPAETPIRLSSETTSRVTSPVARLPFSIVRDDGYSVVLMGGGGGGPPPLTYESVKPLPLTV